MKTASKTIDKLSLVYIKERKVLFAKTKGQKLYYIPGGKREPGENDVQALAREIREELGADIITDSLRFAKVFEAQADNKPPGVMVKITCYVVELDKDPKPTSEIDEIRFLNSSDKGIVPYAGVLILEWLKREDQID